MLLISLMGIFGVNMVPANLFYASDICCTNVRISILYTENC